MKLNKSSANLNSLKNLSKVLALLGMSASLMGNQSCSSAPQRVLARRVLLGQIMAPPITLPPSLGNTQFNFQFVANQQMGNVLNTTQTFSTANMDPNMQFTPSGLAAEMTNDFNVCDSLSGAPVVIQSVASAASSASGLTETSTYTNTCTINLPQAVINGSINDFTLIGGGGLQLSLANIPSAPSVNFDIQSYQMQVEMSAKKPLDKGNFTFVSSVNNANGYKGSLAASFNIGALALGANGYYQTPLSTITMNGLTGATTDLANSWSAQDPWYTTIMKACGTYIYVNGSSDLNLKVGDVLAVKNVTYIWDGAVCDSNSLGDVPDVTPVSYAQIVSLGDNIAAAQIIKGNSSYPLANSTIFAGARVYMHQTVETVQTLQQSAKAKDGVCQLPVGTCASTRAAAAASTSNSSSTSSSN